MAAQKMNNVCLIPARGGSKRIFKKNLIDFHGKPLIAYTIEAALKSKLFGNDIYVSSDSEEILKIADQLGVKSIRRPAKISGDNASLEDVTLHLLGNLEKEVKYLCLLMPNCPLRSALDIKDSFKQLVKSRAQCLMSVVSYYWLNPFWAMQEKNGNIKMFFGKKYLVDSKKLPKNVYCPTGVVRWVRASNFVKEKKYYGKNLIKYEIPFERSADIDEYTDLELARRLIKLRQ
ncbi:MAG: acylneuraminate cytidylyltransferase family protein [Patescibacteria group bacterium]|jgi:CMP-N-acetylneuraminic acid synthetase